VLDRISVVCLIIKKKRDAFIKIAITRLAIYGNLIALNEVESIANLFLY